MPVVEYDHSEGCSVTGGYVYRGKRLAMLYGAYVYGDFCTGRIWALRFDNGQIIERRRIVDSGRRFRRLESTKRASCTSRRSMDGCTD